MKNSIKYELAHNLVAFRSVVLMNDKVRELPPALFHFKLSDLLLKNTDNIAIEMFRESGKSSYALRTFPLHCLCYPDKKLSYIVIIKQNQRMAGCKIKDIINEYLANPLLKHNLVAIKEQSVRVFSVDVKNADGEIINVRIEGFGKGASIRGLSNQDRRPDIVILDDIQDKDDSRSETILSADWDWFLSDIVFLGRTSRIFIIGNNLGEKCVIERCISHAKQLGFTPVKIPVMKDNIPAWPEQQSLEQILNERQNYEQMGKLDIWMAEKMCCAVAQENQIFDPNDYRYYSADLKFDMLNRLNLYACLDPACSTKDTACYRAITLTGVDPDNKWFLLDCPFGRWQPDETINHIFDMVVKYRLKTFYIEKGWWEQTMRNFIFEEMRRRNIFFDVIPLEHAKQGSKLERIKMLQPRFKAHSIYFPDKADFMTEFKAELAGVVRDGIKSEFIDCVDAFAMTEQVATAPYFSNEIHRQEQRNFYSANRSDSLFDIAGY